MLCGTQAVCLGACECNESNACSRYFSGALRHPSRMLGGVCCDTPGRLCKTLVAARPGFRGVRMAILARVWGSLAEHCKQSPHSPGFLGVRMAILARFGKTALAPPNPRQPHSRQLNRVPPYPLRPHLRQPNPTRQFGPPLRLSSHARTPSSLFLPLVSFLS